MESFKNLIHEFGKQLRIQESESDEQGYLALTFDAHTLHIQYDNETNEMVVFTQLGEIEPERVSDICLMLLGANIFWQGTAGATFSVEPTTRMVFLADRQPLSLIDLSYLTNWLELLLDITIYWSHRLDMANAGGSLNPDPETNSFLSPN